MFLIKCLVSVFVLGVCVIISAALFLCISVPFIIFWWFVHSDNIFLVSLMTETGAMSLLARHINRQLSITRTLMLKRPSYLWYSTLVHLWYYWVVLHLPVMGFLLRSIESCTPVSIRSFGPKPGNLQSEWQRFRALRRITNNVLVREGVICGLH